MKRREFLAASALAGLAPLSKLAAAEGGDAAKKQLLELKLYRLKSAAQAKRLDEYLAKAAIPALNRIGIEPVGVFADSDGKSHDLFVLLPHGSAESVVTATARLLADEKYLKDGEKYLTPPKSKPLFERIESSLLLAFDAAPKVETTVKGDERIFQLRIYEAHSVERGQKKIEMFNTGGEIDLFRRCGMNPVFFGEALVGTKVPNLTYMIGFADADAQKAGWAKFIAHPDWKKMSGDPAYKDTVSNITNLVLKPASSSQI